MSELVLRNRQRARRVDTRLLRRITLVLLGELVRAGDGKLCIHVVAAPEMTRLNRQFLRHEGPTDVITFDHTNRPGRQLHGEIFICVDEAISQAQRFRTTWQSEIVRYIIHGILHLLGYDDTRPVARVRMKRQENRLLRQLSQKFTLSRLALPVRRS